MKTIALLIIIIWPLVTLLINGTKAWIREGKDERSASLVAGVVVTMVTYSLYYFAGIIDLFKDSIK